MPVEDPVAAFERVSFAYGVGPPVLRDVSVEIRAGEFVAVAGPNGGGKTTLVRLLLGLERPLSGRVLLFGRPAHAASHRGKVGYLAQRTRLGTEAPATVREVVAAGRLPVTGLLGRPGRADRAAVEEAIARVGLAERASWPLRELSGGQQQRAFIAKALAAEPSLLVLDEPTAGVDADAQESLAAFLARLHAELRTTIVYVSHEFGAVERYVERLLLVRGGIAFDGHPSALPGLWHDPSHVHA
ncbi:MAG TPA: ABC transporter ATP-binding protein [Gaiellaceae bacterium]|nr:ABC transporter ATP-binding protein [Gaiellaceae bacterium]